jgi:CRP/FNR family cyclic AMP-dependent transcriptional regulator
MTDTGERIVLEVAEPGDFFGEISLLDGGARTAWALVREELEALVVDRGDLDEFLLLRPAAAMDLFTALGRRLRESMRLIRGSVSRHPDVVDEDRRTRVMKIADWISEFSGSLPFLFIHCVIFFAWIIVKVPPLSKTWLGGWDEYPFGLLTMSVSLEAIILSVFVLLSQNRQVARDRVRNDVEYDVNVRAELGVAQLNARLDAMHESLSARLERIERAQKVRAEAGPT